MTPGWLIIEGRTGVRQEQLREGDLTMGREADNDIVIPDPFVSRHHARLVWRQGTPTLIDSGSSYGLSSRGQRVKEIVLMPGEVAEIVGPQQGDVVRLSYQPENSVPETALGWTQGSAASEQLTGAATSMVQLNASNMHVSIGRDPGNDIVLDHPQVSRRHMKLDVLGDAATLTNLSPNGTFVNGSLVTRQQLLRAGDRIRISGFEFAFDGRKLVQYDQTRRARIDALHLSTVVGKGTTILHDVTFSALANEMIGIVGTSGSGKSTLMDAMNGFRPATGGSVLVNGRDYYREFASMRLLVGYVPQTDVVHRDLTTSRALEYAAALRLPADTSERERSARVQAVLKEVGLEDRADVIIGQLSGGQIKRVSMAVELLTRPSLFFLDEPTSGLDPGYEKRVMELLRSLANQGRTVLLITHATQNIELCDHVAFMAPGGHLAYFGPPRTALAYFDCTDYPGIYMRIQQESNGAHLAVRFQQHALYQQNVLARLPESQPAVAAVSAPAAPSLPASPAVPWWRQYGILVQRYTETLRRDRRNLLLLALQAPIIAILLALIAKEGSFSPIPDINLLATGRPLLMILCSSAVWLGALNAAREIVKELPIYRRERMVGLHLVPYLLSKYTVLGALCIFQTAILLAALVLRSRIPDAGPLWPTTLELYVTLLLSSFAGLSMGLMISALFNNADRATALVPYLLIPQIIFLVSKLEGISRVLSWLTITHWSVQAMGTSLNLGQYATYLEGIDPLDYVFTRDFLIQKWAILGAFILVFGVASLFFLKRHDGHLM